MNDVLRFKLYVKDHVLQSFVEGVLKEFFIPYVSICKVSQNCYIVDVKWFNTFVDVCIRVVRLVHAFRIVERLAQFFENVWGKGFSHLYFI